VARKSTPKRKPAIGGGDRFRKLEAKLAGQGARDPAGLAAWIGRKKYGKERFQALSESGRRNRQSTSPAKQEHRIRV
jgi:hypothetical protein